MKIFYWKRTELSECEIKDTIVEGLKLQQANDEKNK